MKKFLTERNALIFVCLLAIFLVPFHFTNTPNVWTDEGIFTETARSLAMSGTVGLQTASGEFFSMRNFLLSTSYPVIVPVALSFKFFGIGVFQARLPMILYMFGLLVVSYFFVKKRYGFYPALFSVLLLLSFSPFYGNGRPVQGEVPGLFFLILGSYFLLRYEEYLFQSKKYAFLAGLFLGLSASTKPIFLALVTLAIIIAGLYFVRVLKDKISHHFILLGFGLPVSIWVWIHIPTIESFKTFVSKSFYLASNHGDTTVSLSHTVFTNLSKFFTESTPVLCMIFFVAVLSYFLLICWYKQSEKITIAEFFISSFVVINLVSYLVGTGWYRYFFPAHMLLYLLFPIAVFSLFQISKYSIIKKLPWVILIGLVCFQFYYLAYRSSNSFVSKARAGELTAALSEIDPTKSIFFYNSSEAIVFFEGQNYGQYVRLGDFLEAGDKDFFKHSSTEYILTDTSQSGNVDLFCYTEKPVARYYLLERIPTCKK